MTQAAARILASALRRRIRQLGLVRTALSAFLYALGAVISLPLYFARIRFLRLTAPGRIGHLAGEPDTFLKEGLLGRRPPMRSVLVSPPGTAANECLLDYWSSHIRVIRSAFWSRIATPLSRLPHLRFDAFR